MPLYPKINLEREIGSLCFSRLPYAEIIASLTREIWSFVVCMPHGQVRLKFWEFYDQSWTMDKSPTLCGCVMPKLERSISDRKSGAILQPTYSWICPGSARQTQAKCFTLHYFTCNHTY